MTREKTAPQRRAQQIREAVRAHVELGRQAADGLAWRLKDAMPGSVVRPTEIKRALKTLCRDGTIEYRRIDGTHKMADRQ
jgi:hypothetical protein